MITATAAAFPSLEFARLVSPADAVSKLVIVEFADVEIELEMDPLAEDAALSEVVEDVKLSIIMTLDVPDGPGFVAAAAPGLEMGTFVTAATPRVGTGTSPLTNQPPSDDVGQAGGEIEGVYAACAIPVGLRVFH